MTASTVSDHLAPSRPSSRPGFSRTLRLGARCGRLEIANFVRNPTAMVFSLAFPALLLVLFASIFHDTIPRSGGVTISQYLVAGIMAVGIMTASFSNLAISIAGERGEGTIKRLAATPLPVASYFIGKIVLVVASTAASVVLLFAIGITLFDLPLPSSAGRWATFVWVYLLGVVASSLLGIAVSRVPKNGKVAPAIINPPFLILQFISGTFLDFSSLGTPLKVVASLFPLRWMALGMRSVFLPDSFLRAETGHSWQHGTTLAVLLAWIVGGFVLTRLTFRWREIDR